MIMRKSLKILHTLAACGMVGAVLAYMVLLLAAPQDTATAYAELRQSIAALCDYLLLPSLALVLVSGLLSMAVHRPFLDKRWAWLKAALGLMSSAPDEVMGV
jgi:fructose-specific phosphotransferase system IIC component